MTFAHPDLLGLAVVIPLGVMLLAIIDHVRRQALVRRIGHVPQVQRMLASVSGWRRWLKASLLALGLAAVALAAARPQIPGKRDGAKQGLDVVVALDVSKSMLVNDVGTTRLARARQFIDELLPKLTNDRVAALVFAGAAVHFPLTEDKEVATQFLHDLTPADLPGGSDLGEMFRTATCILRPDTADTFDSPCQGRTKRGHGGDPLPGEPIDTPVAATTAEASERSKVIVLFTDGADRVRPGDGVAGVSEQVDRAKQYGITLVVVGVGTPSGGNVPDTDLDGAPNGRWKYDDNGKPVKSALDPRALRELAEAGGDVNRYFEIGLGDASVDPVVRALDALTRGALERKDERVMNEWFTGFLFVGFMLLVVEACIGTRRRIKFPEG